MPGAAEGHCLHFSGAVKGILLDQHSFQIHLGIWQVSFSAASTLLSHTVAF